MLDGKIKLETFVFREAKYVPLESRHKRGLWCLEHRKRFSIRASDCGALIFTQYSSYLVTPSLDISPLLKMNSPVV